ncbi:MAG: hypothetical protein SFU53_09670 [Terrimicrobiaceae bacterium]|nr:hypothetical protein [Terrimicrobiaceae bacterium]
MELLATWFVSLRENTVTLRVQNGEKSVFVIFGSVLILQEIMQQKLAKHFSSDAPVWEHDMEEQDEPIKPETRKAFSKPVVPEERKEKPQTSHPFPENMTG